MRQLLRGRLTSPAVRIGVAAAVAVAVAGTLGVTAASASPQGGGGGCSPTVSKQFFGKTVEPYTGKTEPVFRYTLTNCRGMQVRILTFGAITQSITVPSRNGTKADVILGFKTLQDYVTEDSPPVTANGGPYFGETVGRYANRIAKGTFKLNGKTYTLPINNGVNSLHGGLVGFGNHIWAAHAVHGPGSAGVSLTLVSPNGDSSGASRVARLPERLHRLPGPADRDRHLHAEQPGPARHPLQRAQRQHEAGHGAQPDQPQLLQPGRRGLARGLGLPPVRADQREQLLADRRDPDPAAAAPTASRSRARRSTSARRTPSARGSTT